jgi:hypothetical protein
MISAYENLARATFTCTPTAAVLRRLRAGESPKLLPLTVIQQDTK